MIRFRSLVQNKNNFKIFSTLFLQKSYSTIDDTYAREVISDANRFVKERKFQQAIDVLKTAKDVNFKNNFKEKQADIHYSIGEIEEASEIYESIVKEDQEKMKDFNFLLKIGEVNSELLNFSEAKKYYRALIDLRQDFYLPYEKLGYLHIAIAETKKYPYEIEEEHKKAKYYFYKSIEYKEDALLSFRGLGLIFQKNKETERSIDSFKKVLEIDSNIYEVNYFLGETYYNAGRYEEALSEYHYFMANFEAFCEQKNQEGKYFEPQKLMEEALMKRALCILATDDNLMAIREFTYIIKFLENSSPNSHYLAYAYNKRGYAYFRKTEFYKCVEDNSKAILLNPRIYQAYRDRSNAYECLGLEEESKEDKRTYEVILREKLLK
eukprot:gene3820-6981_t